MKNKEFWKGAVAGALVVTCIGTGVFAGTGLAAKGTALGDRKCTSKLAYLEELIDRYYLGDKDEEKLQEAVNGLSCMNPEQMEELVELQQKILSVIWQYVKPGGILLYSTCTLDVSENEEMVRYVTEKYPFEAESIDPFLPECLHSQQTKAGFLQLFLGEWDTDGFFMARLRRKK